MTYELLTRSSHRVEEEYYEDEEDEVPPVPELPAIPTEHLRSYQESTKNKSDKKNVDAADDSNSFDDTINSPQINMHKFQSIDLDDPAGYTKETEEEPKASEVDEYADIIRGDDSEEEEDYKPQSSSRFQPLPMSPEVQKFEQIPDQVVEKSKALEPSIDDQGEEEPVEARSSAFQPFPEEEVEQHVSKFEHNIDDTIAQEIKHPHAEQSASSIKSKGVGEHKEPEPIVEATVEADTEALDGDLHDQNKSKYNESSSIQDSGDEAEEGEGSDMEASDVLSRFSVEKEQKDDGVEIPHIQDTSSHDDEDIALKVQDSEDEDDDEYIPTANRFKSSLLEETKPKSSEMEKEKEEDEECQEVQEIEPLQAPKEVEREIEADSSIEEIGHQTIQQPAEELYQGEELQQQVHQLPTTSHGTPVEMRESPNTDRQNFLTPSTSSRQDWGDVSDTDTLHIHDPEDPGSPSIEEIRRELSNTSLHDQPSQLEFNEHAYLGSLINTPEVDENEGQFQSTESHLLDEDDDQVGVLDSSKNKEVVNDNKPPRTISQYYSSVNDYFDDYADTSDNEIPSSKIRDSRASLQSSGSLSTGSFSIRSESRYRYSKNSDSLNHSTSEVHSMVPDNASQSESVKNQPSGGETHLNPALSINFGHWRPDTDSFRDQFISGTAPPLPKLDNYTRNSMGEIVEDRGSIVEKEKELDTASDAGADISRENENDDEAKDAKHDKSLDSIENTISTTDTDSNSVLAEPKNVESYKTESNSILPLHIPLNTPDSKDQPQGQYFHEKLINTDTNLPSQDTSAVANVTASSKLHITKISGNKRTNYNMKQISAISDPARRIDSLRNARTEEANLELGLSDWILHARSSPSVELYKSNVHNSHVAQAYADASTMARKHTLTNNVNSFLHKRRVFQDTSSTAQSLAKGIFTRGKKMLKNDN